ncbi:MAG TPA: S41 family peptidase, partial [Pseudobdellovibrionaceae bacterium]|nr:S41 family peptidase [Pseudobdellovibrionaceae bacterium]
SDLFLKEGVIVSTIGRNKAEKEVISASKNAIYTNFPIIILVNEYSASASEIVSGALQDNNRAIIAGEKTFGKGSVQSVIELNDGSGLKLTVARYFTPKGVSIQAEGITPDIEIEEADADHFQKSFIPKQKSTREKDLDGHLKNDREKLMESQKRMGDASSKWWKDFAVKKDDRDSPGDKLRKSDYQIYQALNYLKTWKTFEKTTVK